MLQHIDHSHPVTLPRSRWRSKIRRFLLGNTRPDWKDRSLPPLLSNSPLSTPNSAHLKRDHVSDETLSLLTPLEVHDDDFYIPLTTHKGVYVGNMMLPPPPPPPQRKLLYEADKFGRAEKVARGGTDRFGRTQTEGFGKGTERLGTDTPPRTKSSPGKQASLLKNPEVFYGHLHGDHFDDFAEQPFAKRKTRAFSDGAVVNQTCFICEELLQTKLVLEKLVLLQCGDCVHGECLRATVDYNLLKLVDEPSIDLDNPLLLRSVLIPACRGHFCGIHNQLVPACPIDDDLTTATLKDAVLTLKLARANIQLNHNVQLNHNGQINHDGQTNHDGQRNHNSQLDQNSQLNHSGLLSRITGGLGSPIDLTFPEVSRPDSGYFLKDDHVLRPKLALGDAADPNYTMDLGAQSRPVSLAPSSVTNLTVSVRISEHDRMPLEELKNAFIKHMIDACGTFDLSMLVALGPLRLADRLLVSVDGLPYTLSKVYLFANFLVMWENSKPAMYPLGAIVAIGTPALSVVEFTFQNCPVSAVRLHSETDSIIEKWGIVIADPSLVIPSDIFTLTMSVFELVAETNRWSSAMGKQVSPILEKSLEQSPTDEIVPSCLNENSVIEQVVQLDVSSQLSLLSPISPLQIRKQLPIAEQDSDSDSDSDVELINRVMAKIH